MNNSDHVLLAVDSGVATLTLNRPEKLNALSADMLEHAAQTLRDMWSDPGIGCIVLTGAGRGFCAGGDISSMAGGGNKAPPTFEERIDRQRYGQELSRLLHHIPKVTLAAVNGPAAGAGLGIALACDMRFASDAASFTTAFSRVGFGGDYGITWGLTHTVGPARAREMLVLSDTISANEAMTLGLVNRVFANDNFMEDVHVLARRIASGPQISYRWMMENVELAINANYHEMLDREAVTHLRCGETEDHKEGVAAFMEKRQASYKGR